MEMAPPSAQDPQVRDHPAVARSFLNTAWPLAALALMLLMLARACMPGTAPAPPPFDGAAAAARANQAALAALRTLPAAAPTDDVLKALNLAVINFASARAEIPADALGVLRQAAAAIAALPAGTRLRITGHSDTVGDAPANQALSLQRAQAVRALLIERGVAGEVLIADGAGDLLPVAPNDTEANRFRNRRIEFATAL